MGKKKRRKRFLKRFQTWLDEALAEEESPNGIAAEILAELDGEAEKEQSGNRFDLYSLWSEMTTLTQEIKLQGRTFKQFHDTASPFIEQTGTIITSNAELLSETRRIAEQAFGERTSREEQVLREAERRTREEMVDVLLDLRERLNRAVSAARAHVDDARRAREPGRLVRILPLGKRKKQTAFDRSIDAAAALIKGCLLSLERLDDALERFGLREIECKGKTFDSHSMSAVDIEETCEALEGEVLDVYRPGFQWNGEVFRVAEVKVARAKRAPQREEE